MKSNSVGSVNSVIKLIEENRQTKKWASNKITVLVWNPIRGPRDSNQVSDEKWKSPVNLLATHPEPNQGNWVSDMKLSSLGLRFLNNSDKTLHWKYERNLVIIRPSRDNILYNGCLGRICFFFTCNLLFSITKH